MADLKDIHAAAQVLLSDEDALTDIAAYLRAVAERTGELSRSGVLIGGLHHHGAIIGALTEIRNNSMGV